MDNILSEENVNKLSKIILTNGFIPAIKYVRPLLPSRGLLDAKKFVEDFVSDNDINVPERKDICAEFLQDMSMLPSDYWNAVARMMISKGWKK